jgi:hypothetical protein
VQVDGIVAEPAFFGQRNYDMNRAIAIDAQPRDSIHSVVQERQHLGRDRGDELVAPTHVREAVALETVQQTPSLQGA